MLVDSPLGVFPKAHAAMPVYFFLASGLPFSFVLRGVVVPPKSEEKERFLELLVAAADDTNYGCHFRVGTSVRCCDHVACLFSERSPLPTTLSFAQLG